MTWRPTATVRVPSSPRWSAPATAGADSPAAASRPGSATSTTSGPGRSGAPPPPTCSPSADDTTASSNDPDGDVRLAPDGTATWTDPTGRSPHHRAARRPDGTGPHRGCRPRPTGNPARSRDGRSSHGVERTRDAPRVHRRAPPARPPRTPRTPPLAAADAPPVHQRGRPAARECPTRGPSRGPPRRTALLEPASEVLAAQHPRRLATAGPARKPATDLSGRR